MRELLVVVALATVGLLATPRRTEWSTAGPWWRVAAAFPVGIALFVCVELGLLVTGLPLARPVVALAIALVVAGAVAARRGGPLVLPDEVPALAIAGILGVAVVGITTWLPLVNITGDSLRYLHSAGLLSAAGDTTPFSVFHLQKRVLTVGALHGLAGPDPGYLRAVTPLVALATVAVLGGAAREIVGRARGGFALALGTGAALLLVTNHRFVFNAFYVNGHMLVAAWVLVTVVVSWRVVTGRVRPTAEQALLVVLASTAVVVTRPEGAIVVATVLVPLVVADEVPRAWRRAVLLGVGAGSLLWHAGVLATVSVSRELSLDLEVLGMLALAVGAVAVGVALPAVDRLVARIADRTGGRPLVAVHAFAWLAVLGLTAVSPGTTWSSAVAILSNVTSEGIWGVSLLLLGALLLLVLPWRTVDGEATWLFPLLTFVPLSVLLAFARGAPWRIGVGDSFNRMLLHVLPIAILALVVTAGGRWRRPPPSWLSSPPEDPARDGRDAHEARSDARPGLGTGA